MQQAAARSPEALRGDADRARAVAGARERDLSGVEPLFSGYSIFRKLGMSTFGAFYRALGGVQLSPTGEEFSLPRVVVIGCEKSGKSTLLETLTKCPIFPRAIGALSFDSLRGSTREYCICIDPPAPAPQESLRECPCALS